MAALAVTQTVGYGVLYYGFAVLLHPMVVALHASTAAITGALTVSLLAGAAMSVPVGRWLDRHGAHVLMTGGSVAATVLVVAWSQVRTVTQLYGVFVGIGVASATVLYGPAFAVIVGQVDTRRRANALLAVTVVAGFASSIFLPLTGTLVGAYGWRTTLLILAAVHGVLTVPPHALALRGRGNPRQRPGSAPRNRDSHRPAGGAAGPVRLALADPGFWVLVVVFVAQTAAVGAMTVHLIGYLTSRGHSPGFAATIAGLLGVLSVTGRLVLTGAQRHIRMTTVVAGIFAVQAIAVLALMQVGGSRVGAILAVTGFGLGFGVATLARPALVADWYGTTRYATIAGLLNVPVTLTAAGAPLAAALLLHATHGYGAVLAAIAACCAVAAAGMLAAGRRHPAPATPRLPPADSQRSAVTTAGQPVG